MKSGSDPNKAAMKQQKAQMKRLDNVSLPELEEYMLQNPELVGLLDAEELDDSALEEISLDSGLRENQMKALQALSQQADEGLTSQDKYAMEQLLGDVSAQERSQLAGIESEMARRGMESSGAAERAKREALQSGSNNARDKAMQMAAQGQQNRMAALQALGQQSGQMESQDFNRQSQVASAKDAISRANAANRQQVSGQNLAATQAIENQRANIANQQSAMGNQLSQQNFSNQMSKASGQGQVASNMSNIAGNAPQRPGALQAGLSGAATGAAASGGNPWGAAVGAGLGILSAEDGGIARKSKEREDRDHERFKKEYMRRVREELAPQSKAAEEVTGGRIHAADGAMIPKYEFGGIVDSNDLSNSGNYTFDQPDIQTEAEMNSMKIPSLQKPEMLQESVPRDVVAETVNNTQLAPQEKLSTDAGSGMNKEDMVKGLGALSKMLGGEEQQKRGTIKTSYQEVAPQNLMSGYEPQQFANPFRAEDGNVANYECGGVHKEAKYASDGMGDIIDSGMDSYAGDRVDAKVNDGEAILNIPQQQRFMDLVRGKISVDELGDDDIIEGVPKDYRDSLHDKIEGGEENESSRAEGLKKLLDILGK